MFLTSSNSKPGDEKARSFDEIIALLDGAGSRSVAGALVNSNTSMRQATVWACVRILSEITAQLPINVQVKQNNQWVTAESHDALEIIAQPNDWMTQHDFVSHLMLWSELVGDGYYFKSKNTRGKIIRMLPIRGDDCMPDMEPNWQLKYELSGEDGLSGTYGPQDIFHLRNFSNNGYKGLSTIGNMREGVGLALKLEEHGAKQFSAGLISSHWIEAPSGMGETDKTAVKQALKSYEGGENSGKTMLLSGGMKLHEMGGMTAADAQYLESRRFQKQDIASIFGVPLFLLNDTEKSTTWGTGLEQLSRSFVRFSLNPRLNRLAQTFNREFITGKDRMRTRFVFDTDGFTLGEFKERMDGYRSAIESGVLNPNECREIESRNSRDGGDEFRIPMNTTQEGNQEGTQDED